MRSVSLTTFTTFTTFTSTYSTMSSKKAVQESRVSAEAAARLIAKDRRLLRLTPENVMMAAITFICTVFGLHIFAKIVS